VQLNEVTANVLCDQSCAISNSSYALAPHSRRERSRKIWVLHVGLHLCGPTSHI